MQQILGHFVVQESQWWILIYFWSLIPNPGFILRFDEPIFPLGLFHVILGLFLIIFWNFCEKWRRIILLNLNERRQYYNDNKQRHTQKCWQTWSCQNFQFWNFKNLTLFSIFLTLFYFFLGKYYRYIWHAVLSFLE